VNFLEEEFKKLLQDQQRVTFLFGEMYGGAMQDGLGGDISEGYLLEKKL